jgi:hypothetical protein
MHPALAVTITIVYACKWQQKTCHGLRLRSRKKLNDNHRDDGLRRLDAANAACTKCKECTWL